MSSFGYGVGIMASILLIITTITFMSYFCTDATTGSAWPVMDAVASEDSDVEATSSSGLDQATLMSYPRVAYSQARLEGRSTTASCYSINLADYKETNELCLQPECGHLFHVVCVNPWLRLNPTCLICRSSLVPSPMPTPLAEVVPLAIAQRS